MPALNLIPCSLSVFVCYICLRTHDAFSFYLFMHQTNCRLVHYVEHYSDGVSKLTLLRKMTLTLFTPKLQYYFFFRMKYYNFNWFMKIQMRFDLQRVLQ